MDRFTEVMLMNARKQALATFFYLDAAKKQNAPQDIIDGLQKEYDEELATVSMYERGVL